ncbi:MAG: hypothetical protein U0800_19305 [Isosphaeraceae bacterium]
MPAFIIVIGIAITSCPGHLNEDELSGTWWRFVDSNCNGVASDKPKNGWGLIVFGDSGDYRYVKNDVPGSAGGLFYRGSYEIGTSGPQKTIDFVANNGQVKYKKEMRLLGVYEIQGDCMKISFAEIGKQRPKSLDSAEHAVETWRKFTPRMKSKQ